MLDTVALDEFLVESSYELWAKNASEIPALYKLAQFLSKNDRVLVTSHSFGGFNMNYGLVYPIFREGSFVLILSLTKMRKTYSHMMPIGVGEAKPEKKIVLPVLLPEI